MKKKLRPKHWIGIGVIILVVSIVIFGSSSDKDNQEDLEKAQIIPAQEQAESQSVNEEETVKESRQETDTIIVDYVIDGDTIKLPDGQSVRLIGIDAPEQGEPYYSESRNKLIELVLNKTVTLEKDVSDVDKYGRLLRYIYVGNTFINLEMVKQGYASAYTYPPDVKHVDQFVSVESQARNAQLGLWKSTLEPEPEPELPPEEDIICSYNAYNCPDFSTHVEAQHVFEYCGGVSNDIHRLDADKDGKACESLP